MATNAYDKGQAVRCSAAFTNAAGAAADPTTVTFKYQDPSGNETTLVYGVDDELAKDGTGQYHVDVVTDEGEEGRWFYRFNGTGAVVASGEGSFWVRRSEF